MEIRAETRSFGHPGDVLRHGVPRHRLRGRHDLPSPGRHHAGRSRRQDGQREMEGHQRRPEEGRDQYGDPLPGEGQGHRRHLRAESGVRGHVTAYDAKTGKKVWRAYSLGPDNEMLFDPEKTMTLGKAVGRDSSLKTWTGDQWKTGGGTAWGWFSYDPETNLIFYGTANPSTWNPVQRAGTDGKPIDQKWTMAIIARDADTGVAKWAYQMTPFDEWDYAGVNEMILADITVQGQPRKVLVHFDRNGLGYTLDRVTGELLVADKFDPKVNWTTGVVMDKNSPQYGRPQVVKEYSTFQTG